MSLDYVSEKLTNAIGSLVGPGSIQLRLGYAAMACHTLSVPGNANDFPSSKLRQRWLAWWSAMTEGPGSIEDHTMRMTDERAGELAKELFDIFVLCEQAWAVARADWVKEDLTDSD